MEIIISGDKNFWFWFILVSILILMIWNTLILFLINVVNHRDRDGYLEELVEINKDMKIYLEGVKGKLVSIENFLYKEKYKDLYESWRDIIHCGESQELCGTGRSGRWPMAVNHARNERVDRLGR